MLQSINQSILGFVAEDRLRQYRSDNFASKARNWGVYRARGLRCAKFTGPGPQIRVHRSVRNESHKIYLLCTALQLHSNFRRGGIVIRGPRCLRNLRCLTSKLALLLRIAEEPVDWPYSTDVCQHESQQHRQHCEIERQWLVKSSSINAIRP